MSMQLQPHLGLLCVPELSRHDNRETYTAHISVATTPRCQLSSHDLNSLDLHAQGAILVECIERMNGTSPG